jgi:hypothetical protein
MSGSALAFILLFTTSAAPLSKAGEKLARARATAGSLEFTSALRGAQEALEAGDASVEETASIHALIGELAAAIGDRDLARSEFSRALVLQPQFDLPSASPRIREPLVEARKQVAKRRLTLSALSVRGADGRVISDLTVAGDLFSLVQSIRVTAKGIRQAGAPSSLHLEWSCTDESCPHTLAALDNFGNELGVVGTASAPLRVRLRPELVPGVTSNEPIALQAAPAKWYARATTWLIAVTGVLLVVGTWAAVAFDQDQRRLVAIEANRPAFMLSDALNADSARLRDRGLMIGAFSASAVSAGLAIFAW